MKKYSLYTPDQVGRELAAKVRGLRLSMNWKQTTLAGKSGVSLASLRRFESTGLVSMTNLLRLAFALNRLDDFTTILDPPHAASMAELEASQRRKSDKRGAL